METLQATSILIDPRNKAISKVEVDPVDKLYDQIYLKQSDEYDDYIAAVDQSICNVVAASDCGFILRFDGKKFVVPGCAMVERIYTHDNLDRMDTPFTLEDFVVSNVGINGKFAIEWL